MNKVLLIIAITFCSCVDNSKENKLFIRNERVRSMNYTINDTFTLNDGHIYYSKWSQGELPIHSQYCKHYE